MPSNVVPNSVDQNNALVAQSQESIIYNNEILNHESDLEKIIQFALKKYYLIPYPDVESENGIFRDFHGGDHAIRTSILVDFFVTLYRRYYPEGLVKPGNTDFDLMDLKLVRLAAIYHDSANTSEVFHDEIKHAENFYRDMLLLGFPNERVRIVAWSMAHKDTSGLKNIFQRLIHDADCVEYLRILVCEVSDEELDIKNIGLLQNKYFFKFREDFLDFKKLIDVNLRQRYDAALNTLQDIISLQKQFIIKTCTSQSKIFFQTLLNPYRYYKEQVQAIYADMMENLLEKDQLYFPQRRIQPLDDTLNPADKFLVLDQCDNYLHMLDQPEVFLDDNRDTKLLQHSLLLKMFHNGEVFIRRLDTDNGSSRVREELKCIDEHVKFRPATLVMSGVPILNYGHPKYLAGILIDALNTNVYHAYKENVCSDLIGVNNFTFDRTANRCKDKKTLDIMRGKIQEIEMRRRGHAHDNYNSYYGQASIRHNEMLIKYQKTNIIGLVVGDSPESAKDALNLYLILQNPSLNFYYYSHLFGLFKLSTSQVLSLAGISIKAVPQPPTISRLEEDTVRLRGLKINQQYLRNLSAEIHNFHITKNSSDNYIKYTFTYQDITKGLSPFECYVDNYGFSIINNTLSGESFYDTEGLLNQLVINYQIKKSLEVKNILKRINIYLEHKYSLSKLFCKFETTMSRFQKKYSIVISGTYQSCENNLNQILEQLFILKPKSKELSTGSKSPITFFWQIRIPEHIDEILSALQLFELEIEKLIRLYSLKSTMLEQDYKWFESAHKKTIYRNMMEEGRNNPSRYNSIFQELLSENALEYCENILNLATINASKIFAPRNFETALSKELSKLTRFIISKETDLVAFLENHAIFIAKSLANSRQKNILIEVINGCNQLRLFYTLSTLMSRQKYSIATIVIELLFGSNLRLLQDPESKNTLLHEAIKTKNLSLIEQLLSGGCSILARNAKNKSPLELAFREKDILDIFLTSLKDTSPKELVENTLLGLVRDGRRSEAEIISEAISVKEYIKSMSADLKVILADEFASYGASYIVKHFFINPTDVLPQFQYAYKQQRKHFLRYFQAWVNTLSEEQLMSYHLEKCADSTALQDFILMLEIPKQDFIMKQLVARFISAIRQNVASEITFLQHIVNTFKINGSNNALCATAFRELEIGFAPSTYVFKNSFLAKWEGSLHHFAIKPGFSNDHKLLLRYICRDAKNIDSVTLFSPPWDMSIFCKGTALHAAIMWRQESSVEVLLKNGASVLKGIIFDHQYWDNAIDFSTYEKCSNNKITNLLIRGLVVEQYKYCLTEKSKIKFSFFNPIAFNLTRLTGQIHLEKCLERGFESFWSVFGSECHLLRYNLFIDDGKYLLELIDKFINDLLRKVNASNEKQALSLIKQLTTYKVAALELFTTKNENENFEANHLISLPQI